MAKKIAFIGHSHSVAILDAIGDWRRAASLELDNTHQDPRYTKKFRGWFTADPSRNMFEFSPRPGFERFSGMRVCLMTSASAAATGRLAWVATGGPGATIEMSPFFADLVAHLADFDVIISMLYGSDLAPFMIPNALPEYDFWPFDGTPNAQPVDRKYIQDEVDSAVNKIVVPLTCLKEAAATAKFVHIPPPPPLRDPSVARMREVWGESVDYFGFLRPELRKKWYSLFMERLQRALVRRGISLLSPYYDDALDDGFLRPDHAEGMTHANTRYGLAVATELARTIEAL